jgi:hypothetical protein
MRHIAVAFGGPHTPAAMLARDRSTMNKRWTKDLVMIMLGVAMTTLASAIVQPSHPIVAAVIRGDCGAAVKLLNPVVTSNDDQTSFLAGRMLDEGICVQRNPVAAAHFYERAAGLGDKTAALDYAAKVGLGVGAAQSYERAGDLCHDAGLDPEARLSRYSLGYVCTVRAVAGKLLRTNLPRGAFQGSPPAVLIDFTPANAEMHVRTMPHVKQMDAPTGSNLRVPLVNAQQEIERAWRSAVDGVPKPDAAQLDNQVIQVSLDVDMTLEGGREGTRENTNAQPFRSLQPGDIMPGGEMFNSAGK